jgi:hypothetical protein
VIKPAVPLCDHFTAWTKLVKWRRVTLNKHSPALLQSPFLAEGRCE